jgi:hypothetical protein
MLAGADAAVGQDISKKTQQLQVPARIQFYGGQRVQNKGSQ